MCDVALPVSDTGRRVRLAPPAYPTPSSHTPDTLSLHLNASSYDFVLKYERFINSPYFIYSGTITSYTFYIFIRNDTNCSTQYSNILFLYCFLLYHFYFYRHSLSFIVGWYPTIDLKYQHDFHPYCRCHM